MNSSKASMKRKSLLVDLLTSHVPLKRIRTSPGPVSSSVVNEILGPCPICCDSGDENLVPLHRTNQNDEKILREIFGEDNYANDLLWNCVTCSKTLRELGELKAQKDHIQNRIEQITFSIRAVVRNKKTKNKSTVTPEDVKPIIKLEGNVSSFKPGSDDSISNEEFMPQDIKSEEIEPFTIICKELELTDIESDCDEGLSATKLHNELEMDNDNVSFSKKTNNEIVSNVTEELEEISATIPKLPILNDQDIELSDNSQNQPFKAKPTKSCDNCGKAFSSNYHVRRHMQNKVCTKNKRPIKSFGVSDKSDNILQFKPKAPIKQGDCEIAQQNELNAANEEKSFDEVKVELCEDIPDVEFSNCHELEDVQGAESIQEFVEEEEIIPAENIDQDTTKRVQRASKARASELIHSLLQEKSKKKESDDSEPEGTDSEFEDSEEFDENDSDFEEDESIGEQTEPGNCLDVIRDLPRISTAKPPSAVIPPASTSSKRVQKRNKQGQFKQIKNKINEKETEPDDEMNNNCDICAQEIIGSNAFQHHLLSNTHKLATISKIESDSVGYKCVLEQCEKTFNLIHDMVKHFRRHPDHGECKVCKTTFKRKKSYIRHLLSNIHAESMALKYGPEFLLKFEKLKKFACNSCDKSFASLGLLQGHHKSVHNLPYLCEICSKTFRYDGMLKKHQLVHQEKPLVPKERVRSAPPKEKSKICRLCGKTFRTISTLHLHRKSVHKGYRYKCTHCPKEYSKYEGLRHHRLTTHGTQEEREKVRRTANATYSCGICGKSLVGKVNLMAHIELVHFPLRENCPAGCELPEKFKNDDEWKEHLENCESEKLGEPAKCFFCQAIFPNSLLQLQHHLQSHQTHSCNYCNKIFTKPVVRNRHLNIHKESREFLCPKCGKSFRAPYNLTLHMKIVCNDDEDSKKELAEKRKKKYLDFRNKSNKYKCNKCPKRFVDENKLKEHLEKAHIDDVEEEGGE